jgi:hypothetical protein
MWQGAEWVCALVAMSSNSVPDSGPVQSAYQREASAGSTLHDSGPQVSQAKCHEDGTDKFLCEVTFISKRCGVPLFRHRCRCPGRARNSRAACANLKGQGLHGSNTAIRMPCGARA